MALAPGTTDPSWLKKDSLSTGTRKLVWLRTLKNSARNWMLKFSEILRTGMFLKSEKSRSRRPGPTIWFRPKLPRRLEQYTCPAGGRALAPENGLHWEANEAGAVGGEKQFRLT